MVRFYEKRIKGANFLEKEFNSDVNIFWMIFLIFTFALNYQQQTCNYSRKNEDIDLKFSGNI